MPPVYRLYQRDAITQGRWYLAAKCKGCGEPINVLDDPSHGKTAFEMGGGGKFSIPCLLCLHDDQYGPNELFNHQAEADLPGARPPRVPVSKSSRKRLDQCFPRARATFGVGYVEDRPKAAAIIARVVTAWADVEVQCARLLAELMGINAPAAAAVFGSLRSSRTQHDALAAAAGAVLEQADVELFEAHMARRASLEKERNDLAHGCFGVSVQLPEAIIWTAQVDYIAFTAANRGVDESALVDFRKKQFVYELGTLERIAQEIEEFYNQLASFIGYLSARNMGATGSAFRTQRYDPLCKQPHIAEALHRVRTAKKSSQAPPKVSQSNKRR